MSSTKALFGFRATRTLGSTPNSMGVSRYRINPGGNSSNIFKGDAVNLTTNSAASYGITPIVTTTDNPIGVFLGCVYNDPTTKRPTWSMYYPANTSVGTDPFGIQAMVVDNPNQTFLIQADASVSVGDIGSNFDVTLGAGSTTTFESGFGLKATSRTTGAAMLRLIDIYDYPGNALSDAFPIVEVKFNQDRYNVVSAA